MRSEAIGGVCLCLGVDPGAWRTIQSPKATFLLDFSLRMAAAQPHKKQVPGSRSNLIQSKFFGSASVLYQEKVLMLWLAGGGRPGFCWCCI